MILTGKKLLIFKIILTLVLEAAAFCALAIVFFLSFFSLTFHRLVSPLMTMGVAAMALIPMVIFWRAKRKIIAFIFAGLMALSLAAIGAGFYMEYRDDKVTRLSDGYFEPRDYQPFSSNVPRLPKESSLKISSHLPVLDGALALYPLYSAFATALYPKGEYDPYDYTYNAVEVDENALADDGEEDYAVEYGEWEGVYNQPVHYTNTIDGFKGLIDGRVDILFIAEPSEEQKEMAKEKGVALRYTPIGREAFVFFVNSKNPVKSLTVEEIRGIYSGNITSWRALGGKGEIKAFQRNENSGSQSALLRFMGSTPLMPPPEKAVAGDMGGIVNHVADYTNYKNALGFSFRYFTNTLVKNKEIRLLKVNGVAPTWENVQNGTYPLAASFYAVTRIERLRGSGKEENIEKMLEWFTGEEGQYLVEKVMGE